MEKSTWKPWIKRTAFLCLFVISLEIILSVAKSSNIVYADSENDVTLLASSKPQKLGKEVDHIKLDLSEYNLPERVVKKESPNETGLKILYDDGSWLYLHEYINMESDYSMGMLYDEELINAQHIVGFEVAPGYEVIISDGTKRKDEKGEEKEEHKTRIIGPLRLLGRSEAEYLENEDYKEKDGKKGSIRDEKGEYELSPSAFRSSSDNAGGFNYALASGQQFSKIWEYNWADILAKEHKKDSNNKNIPGSYSVNDVRDDVKIFNIKSIMIKKTTLKEGVYLMRGMFNVLNGETAKDMEESFNRGIFEYISPNINEDDPEVMYYANEMKTNGSVNGIMVVGNYEVRMQRNRSKAEIGEESSTSTEYLTVQGSKNKAVVITDAWRLNYGYREVDSDGIPRYSVNLVKGMLNALVEYEKNTIVANGIVAGTGLGLIGLHAIGAAAPVLAHILGVVGIATGGVGFVIEAVVIGAAAAITAAIVWVVGILKTKKRLDETMEVKPYYNDLVNVMIIQREEGAKEVDYDNCVYFEAKDTQYAFTRKGEVSKNKYEEFKEKEKLFEISRYDTYVKLYDLPENKEEPVVTAYTKENFKGDYFRFYTGETNNIGEDREIEKIKSIEIAPNTKVIFSDQEDCYHITKPNYGTIERNDGETNALVVEGPAYISDLGKYLDSCYIKGNQLETNKMVLKSFRVQYAKNTDKGVSVYREQDGIGTFENNEVLINSIKDTINVMEQNIKNKKMISGAKNILAEGLAYLGIKINTNSNQKEEEIRKQEQELMIQKNNVKEILEKDVNLLTVDDLNGKQIDLLQYFPQSVSIRGNYFVKLYDENDNVTRTLIGPAQNYNLRLDPENEQKLRDYSNSINTYKLFTDSEKLDYEDVKVYEASTFGKNYSFDTVDIKYEDGQAVDVGDDYMGVELGIIIGGQNSNGLGYNNLSTKALEYLKEFCEAHKGSQQDAINDRNIKGVPDKDASIRIISRAFLNFYRKKSKEFIKTSIIKENGKVSEDRILKDNMAHILDVLYKNKDYLALKEKYKLERENAKAMVEKTKGYVDSIKDMYTKWKNMKIVINKLTQRDAKSRSLENVDGVILYQGKNYNESLGGPENVWTRIPKNQLVNVSTGEPEAGITLSKESGFSMEVEYDNINSIKITGTLAGVYQLVITDDKGVVKKTRYSIPNLKEFFGKANDETLRIKSIKLEKAAETKDLEILLDVSNKSNTVAEISDFKKINTTETRVKKQEMSTSGETDFTQREVYMVSLFDVLDKIGASMEYSYKYDITGANADELVGVKIIRDVGDIGTTTPFKAGEKKETYHNIDKNINKVVREVELKFNKMSIEDIFSSSEFTVNDEYNYTQESRGMIITDHGYVTDANNEEIEVDNAVVTRYYKDVLEVPPMFVKEDYREVIENGEKVIENGKAKKISYMRAIREDEVNIGNDTKLAVNEENEKKGNSKLLYVPVCYKEGENVFTGYLFEQLGIKASIANGKIKLQY